MRTWRAILRLFTLCRLWTRVVTLLALTILGAGFTATITITGTLPLWTRIAVALSLLLAFTVLGTVC